MIITTNSYPAILLHRKTLEFFCWAGEWGWECQVEGNHKAAEKHTAFILFLEKVREGSGFFCGSCGNLLGDCYHSQCQWGSAEQAFWHEGVGELLHFPCGSPCPACDPDWSLHHKEIGHD